MRNVRYENISEHSYDVVVISHALALISNERFGEKINIEKCVLLALYHDVTEIFTGDLPTPIKYYNDNIRKAYKVVETETAGKLADMLPSDLKEHYIPLIMPDESSAEYKIVKAADKISAYIKCLEEIENGNNEFKTAFESIKETISKSEIAAVKVFIDEFTPSYKLTIDEQSF